MKKDTVIRIISIWVVSFAIVVSSIAFLHEINIKRNGAVLLITAILTAIVFLIDRCNKGSLVSMLEKECLRKSIIDILVYALITVFAIYVRIEFISFESEDFQFYFGKWVDQFRELGWHSLGCNIGDYSPLYTSLLIVFSMLDIDRLVAAKIIPIACDFILAVACAKLYREINSKKSDSGSLLVYVAIIMNPLVVLNSSAWAQVDSVYTAFIILSILAYFRAKKAENGSYEWVFIFYAIAFAMKFQAIFVLPVLLLFTVISDEKRVSFTQLVWIPIVYIASAVPMLFCGRSLKDVILVYFGQMGEYTNFLTMRYYNFYSMLGNPQTEINSGLFSLGLILAVTVLGIVYYLIIERKQRITFEKTLLIISITVLVLIYFLPSMHERYANVAEIVLVVLAFVNRRYVVSALATAICTLFSYGEYLSRDTFAVTNQGRILISIVRLCVILYLTYYLFSDHIHEKEHV